MSFDTHLKILSDLCHFGSLGEIAKKIESMLDKNEGIQDINSVVKLLDSLNISDLGLEQ